MRGKVLSFSALGCYNKSMNLYDCIEEAFCAELHKIGASNMRVPQVRIGRRSIRADTLLKRDREGTLLKHAPKPALDNEEKR